MESIYFVMSWLCHRTCEHCYEDRFHPYHGEARSDLVRESQSNVPRIIENFPDRMTYLDLADPDARFNLQLATRTLATIRALETDRTISGPERAV